MIDFEKLKEETIENMRGGEGIVKARRFCDGNVKLMRLTLEKGCSIGLHRHEKNCEALYVLSGTANFTLNGSQEVATPGCCHYCPEGSEHAVINLHDEPLVMIAVVAPA